MDSEFRLQALSPTSGLKVLWRENEHWEKRLKRSRWPAGAFQLTGPGHVLLQLYKDFGPLSGTCRGRRAAIGAEMSALSVHVGNSSQNDCRHWAWTLHQNRNP
eukprot:6469601-Amphidinium_carterae.4